MKKKTKVNLLILLSLIIFTSINISSAADDDELELPREGGFTMIEMVDALIELEKASVKDKDDKYECNYFECCVIYKDKDKDKDKDKCVELKTKEVKIK